MTAADSQTATRLVVIGGREHVKPWDPACAACRSPWLISIDSMLAEGYALRQVCGHLAGLRPAVPGEAVLRSHIRHLAAPHRKAREAFEEAAKARGDDTATSGLRLSDALAAIIRQGVEQQAHGGMEIGARDMIAAMKLQLQLDRDRSGGEVEASAWQAAFMSFFEIVRRHLSGQKWQAFTADVYASPEIAAVLAGQCSLPGAPGG